MVFDQKLIRILNHGAKHTSNFLAVRREPLVFLDGDIFAVTSEIKACFRFAVFSIAVGEFADEMGFVPSFGPSLPQILADGTRASSDLAGQGKHLLAWKSFGNFEYSYGQRIRLFINDQLLRGNDFKEMITGFDRIVFKGMLLSLGFADGAMTYLGNRGVLNKCFKDWAIKNSGDLCLAVGNYSMRTIGRPVEYLSSWRERKEELAHKRQDEMGIESGLIGVWSCLETGRTFKAKFAPGLGRPALVPYRTPCKHLYLYFDHEDYGFMSVRLQTWFPFHVQVCLNGREWMRRSLEKRGVDFSMIGNKLIRCGDWALAQDALDAQLDARWARTLNGFLKIAFPTMRDALSVGLDYYWTLWQSEWATDFICDSPRDLEPIMTSLLRHAFMTGTSQRVLRYMGRPVTKSGYPRVNASDQVSSRCSVYHEGLRVRHWAGSNSVKV